ncbi:MAG: MoaD/ThiS family protein [Granulosicoccus sp.]
MPLNIKFGGPLVRYKPQECVGNTASVDKVEGMTLTSLLNELGIPEEQRLLVILNGSVIAADFYESTQLSDTDDLSLMPPIQAG